MIRTLLVPIAICLVLLALSLAAGRTGGRAAIGPVVAGVGVAFASILMVDCRQCASGALYVGALVSLPFAVVGWLLLLLDREGLSRGAWLIIRVACWFQVAWAAMITATATFGGACPCTAFGWGDPLVRLRAVGTDRLVGPVLVVVALITLALARRARGRARQAG
jgi:hypothetical protein